MKIGVKGIEITYWDGSRVKVQPYRLATSDEGFHIPEHQRRTDFGLSHYDKKGRETKYEGGWKTDQLLDWLRGVIQVDGSGTPDGV